MRDERFYGNRAFSGSRATSHARCFRSRPDPVIQHMVECEADGMLNGTVRRTGCTGADCTGADTSSALASSEATGSPVASDVPCPCGVREFKDPALKN